MVDMLNCVTMLYWTWWTHNDEKYSCWFTPDEPAFKKLWLRACKGWEVC